MAIAIESLNNTWKRTTGHHYGRERHHMLDLCMPNIFSWWQKNWSNNLPSWRGVVGVETENKKSLFYYEAKLFCGTRPQLTFRYTT